MIISMDTKAIEIPNQARETTCIIFKPDGRHLISGGSSGYLRQWKVGSGNEAPLATKSYSDSISTIAASMDGQWIVSGGGYTVTLWSAVTHKIIRYISEHTGYTVYAVDVSNNSTLVASAQGYTVRVFEIISGVRVIPPLEHNDTVVGVKFSPDGTRIATARNRLIDIYDVHSGDKLLGLPVYIPGQSTPITPLAWSFDGQQLLFSSSGKIACFDTSTSLHLEWFIKNDDDDTTTKVYNVVTHGRFIACSAGRSVSFWDYASHKQIGTIIDHVQSINCISVSHNGKYLACGHWEGITVHSLSDYLPLDYLRIPRIPRIPLLQVSDRALESWMLGNATDTESILSEEIENSNPSDNHALACRSLMRTRLGEWKTAIEDAERSLQIEQSPVGHIARSLALVGAGKPEGALDDFELAFCRCNSSDNTLLLVIKSILTFVCGKHEQAISHLRYVITVADEKEKGHYIRVLGNMYLKQGDYENAVQTLVLAKIPSTSKDSNHLLAISLISNWNFDRLEDIACQRLCESLYTSGRIEEIGEILQRIVSSLAENEKEPAHGRILEEIVTRSGRVTLLAWTGKSSKCNSCLPSSLSVYSQQPFVPPRFEPAELERHTEELRAVFPFADALVIYDRATRWQPVRFAHFRLLLPCIVFGVRSLRINQEDGLYHAEAPGLGDVEFTTADALPMKEPQRLIFADLRIHGLLEPHAGGSATWEDRLVSNSLDRGNDVADTSAELVHLPIIEEVPTTPQLDTYTRALHLIAHLGQPFSALLLLRQSDGAYKRVAADTEIIVRGTGNNVPRDICVEVLEIL